MGIVKMDRLTLVGLAREKEAVLAALSKLGAVEIRENPEQPGIYRAQQEAQQVRLQQLQQQRQLLESVLPQMKDCLPRKKPLFQLKRSVSMEAFLHAAEPAAREAVLQTAERFRENRREHQDELAAQAACRLQIDVLLPWQEALGQEDPSHTRRIHRWPGRLSNRAQFDRLEAHLREEVPASVLVPLLETDPKAPVFALLAAPVSAGDLPLQAAQAKGFKPLPRKQPADSPQAEYTRAQAALETHRERAEALEEEARRLAASIPDCELLSDVLQVEIDRAEAAGRVPTTGRLFALEGYIPSHLVKGTRKGLTETFHVSLDTAPADRDTDYPILLHNNRFTRPYEAITDMFSLPTASEVDPVPSVMPFYALFFGMMFSDIAYGILLSLFTGILVWKVKVQGNFRKMCQVFFQCGLTSIVFGALFGGMFGNLVGNFSQVMLGNASIALKPLWFDPMQDPIRLMLWSVIIGTLHIFVGMGIKIHVLAATGRVKEAIFDVAPWYLIIGGLGLFAGGSAGGNPLYSSIGKWAALAGTAVILLMAGRPSKNPIRRLFAGLGSLYGVTGYFSDIMSYTRILALALSTSVIAMVVNLLSLLPGRSIFGLLFFIPVALLGHTLNFALSALSAYVHTTRLHYVEYFGKCLDGGGRAFAPLAYRTKYVLPDRPADPKPETESLRKRFSRFLRPQE